MPGCRQPLVHTSVFTFQSNWAILRLVCFCLLQARPAADPPTAVVVHPPPAASAAAGQPPVASSTEIDTGQPLYAKPDHTVVVIPTSLAGPKQSASEKQPAEHSKNDNKAITAGDGSLDSGHSAAGLCVRVMSVNPGQGSAPSAVSAACCGNAVYILRRGRKYKNCIAQADARRSLPVERKACV